MDFGWSLGLKGRMTQPPSQTARQFWYDTILYDPASLSFLAKAVGVEHIVVGSDYPFSIRQKQPGAFATRALGNQAVLADNALAFLGRNHDVKKLDRAGAPASVSTQGSRAGG
jgi:aminocarboxymuconate-semialdehyde decarboxylase